MGVRGFGDFLWVSTSAGSGSAARMTALVLLCSVFCLLLDVIFCSLSFLMSRCQCHIRVVRVLGLSGSMRLAVLVGGFIFTHVSVLMLLYV